MPESGVRFFVDENLLPLGKALVAVRRDVCYPGHRRIPEVPLSTDDVEWLRVVGEHRLIAITRDRKLRSRTGQRLALLDSGARVITLGTKRSLTQWEWLDLVVRTWGRIEASTDRPGPWVQSLSMGGLTDLPTHRDGRGGRPIPP